MDLPPPRSDAARSPRLVVFADDWGRHPSSAQHLARHLRRDYRIEWVNIAGTRRPHLQPADLRRGMEKLRHWMTGDGGKPGPTPPGPPGSTEPGSAGPGLFVHSPVHWPGFRYRLECQANDLLLRRGLRALLASHPEPAVVITTHPLVAGLVRLFPWLNWVYYMVDDLSAWPGLDGATLRRMEAQMLPLMRRVIAASAVLQDRVREAGGHAELLTHGVDVAGWAAITRAPPCGAGRRPKALYWGNADARLDAEICLAVAARCDLLMVGPRAVVDARLLAHPGITWRPPVAFAALPALAAAADVLVMPYARLPVTEAMQPLKLKEYLATPLPVIATCLPSTGPWADALDRSDDPAEFAERCVLRAGQALPPAQAQARLRLVAEGWEAKAGMFEAMLGLRVAP